jgi:glycosyltransferase involved in cell wall biosynthesis
MAKFTSVSDSGKGQLVEQAGIPPGRVAVLRNGIDPAAFADPDPSARRQPRSHLQLEDTDFVVCTVGSLAPIKRHDLLIRAVAGVVPRVPGVCLLIVGDGPQRPALEALARAEGIAGRVRFAGWRDDIPAVLAGMDAYVCSSESEGMNNAMLEAMAAGLPAIATDVGDNGAVMRDGLEGLLVEPGSVRAISAALVLLADSSELRGRLASAARARSRSYDIAEAVRGYERYYERLCSTGGRRRSAANAEGAAPYAMI